MINDDDVLIRVENLSKKYLISSEKQKSLKASVLALFKGNKFKETIWAVNNVSFTAKRGETLGVIGANGAGKSTLLGLISKTITPTTGKVETFGRVSSLLELGAGFHPDLTGRENVYLNAAILGISKKGIQRKYNEIVAFANLEKFIDTPVKYYSSGMYIRLGFSVAVLVDPDILLVDEVLAVGDENFKQKSFAKIKSFQESGKTILVVSHDLDTIEKICDRVILLGEGKVLSLNKPEKVVKEYKNLGLQQRDDVDKREWGNNLIKIEHVSFLNKEGAAQDRFCSGEELNIKIEYQAAQKVIDPVFGFSVSDYEGKLCYGTNTAIEKLTIDSVEGKGVLNLKITAMNLLRGKFHFSFAVHSRDHQLNYHRLDKWYTIWIISEHEAEGFVEMPCKFIL